MAETTPLLSCDEESQIADLKKTPMMRSTKMKTKFMSTKAGDGGVGDITWLDVMQFALNKDNWGCIALFVIACVVTIRIMYFEVVMRKGHIFGYMFLTTMLSLVGCVGGAYYTYICKKLEALVNQLDEKVRALGVINDDLKETTEKQKKICEDLQGELEKFSTLREEMQKFATEQNEDFQKIFSKAVGVFDGMQKAVEQQRQQNNIQKALNMKNACMMAEMSDMEFGMNESEFRNFYPTIAEDVKLKGKIVTFEALVTKSAAKWDAMPGDNPKNQIHREVIFELIGELTTN